VHEACAVKFFAIRNVANTFDSNTSVDTPSQYLVCDKCKVSSIVCSKEYSIVNKNIGTLKCPTSPCNKWCFCQLPTPSCASSTGCKITTLTENKSMSYIDCVIKNTTTSTVPDGFIPLQKPSTRNLNHTLSKISAQKLLKYHEQIFNVISEMIGDGANFISAFTDYDECNEYLDLHFSHLEAKSNNIYTPNDPTKGLLPGLFLTVNALRR